MTERADRYLKKMRDLGWGGGEKHPRPRQRSISADQGEVAGTLNTGWGDRDLARGEENGVYRFYHQSHKVFYLQDATVAGFKLIDEIGGEARPTEPHTFARCSD